MVAEVMGKMGEPTKTGAMIYKAISQAVLLYGSKNWVATDVMMMVLEGFHHSTEKKGDIG